MTGGADPSGEEAWRARCEESFGRQGLMRHLGAAIALPARGVCEVRLPRRPEVMQQHGHVHGGAVGAVADTAMGYAAFSLMPEGAAVVSVEYKISFLRPARGALLLARARVVKPGRTLVFVAAELFAVDADGREAACASATATMMCLAGAGDGMRPDDAPPAGPPPPPA